MDVYLGKEFHCADIDGVPHAILNGWLGSVPYQKGMTYENLLDLVRQHLPVSSAVCIAQIPTYMYIHTYIHTYVYVKCMCICWKLLSNRHV